MRRRLCKRLTIAAAALVWAGLTPPLAAGEREEAAAYLDDDAAHFLLVTLWESLDAVKDFAGPEPEVAKYYPEDDDFLLEKEPISQLYEVFHQA